MKPLTYAAENSVMTPSDSMLCFIRNMDKVRTTGGDLPFVIC
jgi:hypothetical protein